MQGENALQKNPLTSLCLSLPLQPPAVSLQQLQNPKMDFSTRLIDRVHSDDQATQLQAKCIQNNACLDRKCCMYTVASLALMSLGSYEYDQKM